MTDSLATINGAELYWESAGEGPPVVLIHAGVADGRMWDDLFSRLSEDFRSIRFDLRGFGRSSFPGGPYSHVSDLEGLFQIARIDSAALVGASFGGEVAIDFTLLHPRRVTKLVLAASALGGHEWSEEVRRFGEAEDVALEAGDVEEAVELNLRMWVDGPAREASAVPPPVRDRVRDMQRLAFEKQISAYGQSPPPSSSHELDPPAASRLVEIEAPALVVVGDQDVADILDIADLLNENIPDATKIVIPGAAHMVNLENPEEFNELVVAFLRKQGS